jgi:hypothetical protein
MNTVISVNYYIPCRMAYHECSNNMVHPLLCGLSHTNCQLEQLNPITHQSSTYGMYTLAGYTQWTLTGLIGVLCFTYCST